MTKLEKGLQENNMSTRTSESVSSFSHLNTLNDTISWLICYK